MRGSYRTLLAVLMYGGLLLLTPGAYGQITPADKTAALKEKEVTYYTASATGHATKVKAEAEKILGIKVNLVRLSSGLIYNRAVKEFETGVHAADIIETSVIEHFIDMKKKGMLQAFQPGSVALYRGPAYYDPEHYWHASRVGLGAINYNKELIKGDMIPKTWRDLTDPKYKDKLVQGHIKASGTSAIVDFFLVKLYGWEYFEALRKNNILTHQSCDQATMLSSGERLVSLCDHQSTAPAQAQGLPLETVFPADGVFVQIGPIALLAKAPHPNAGKLFIDWLTSPAGQTMHVTGGILSPLESPEVTYPPGFPDVKTLKLLIPDPTEVGAWLPAAREKFSELFGG